MSHFGDFIQDLKFMKFLSEIFCCFACDHLRWKWLHNNGFSDSCTSYFLKDRYNKTDDFCSYSSLLGWIALFCLEMNNQL
jgi:hypothetical protein